MIKLACDLPERKDEFYLACSGGSDSMVALDFLLRGGRKPRLIHINHGTEHGKDAESFVREKAEALKLDLTIIKIDKRSIPKGSHSKEEFWRNERYKVFNGLKVPVITAHHLDDVVEWWIFSALHGNPRLTPVKNKNVIRPFLFTTKEKLLKWAYDHDVKWKEDPSNAGTDEHMRNVVRHAIMKHAIWINPGIHKTMRKLYK